MGCLSAFPPALELCASLAASGPVDFCVDCCRVVGAGYAYRATVGVHVLHACIRVRVRVRVRVAVRVRVRVRVFRVCVCMRARFPAMSLPSALSYGL